MEELQMIYLGYQVLLNCQLDFNDQPQLNRIPAVLNQGRTAWSLDAGGGGEDDGGLDGALSDQDEVEMGSMRVEQMRVRKAEWQKSTEI